MSAFTIAGWGFERTAPRADSIQTWYEVECQPGDRSPGDNDHVDRVRLDGYRNLIRAGKPFVIRFSFVAGDGWNLHNPGDWTVIHELHALGVRNHGPFELSAVRFSNGQVRLVASAFDLKDGQPINSQSADLGPMLVNTQVDVRIEGQTGDNSNLTVLIANQAKLAINGFGYGSAALYPQFGIYRNARPDRQTLELRIDELTVT